MAQLNAEQERSESLLLSGLPTEISEGLKNTNRTIAQRHEAMSVLFSDVVGSTSLTVEYEPGPMVEILNVAVSYPHLKLPTKAEV